MTKTMFKVECNACKSTGLYKGFAEPPGHAVVCYQCDGKGYFEASSVASTAVLFTGRKAKPGITQVLLDGGLWMFRTGKEKSISIEKFNELIK